MEVDQLEAMFQKADSDLTYLERKLEFEFNTDGAGEGQVNPQQLVQKVQQVKKDYAAIAKDIQGIQESQQETMEYFRSQLKSATEMLQKLQHQTGQESGEPPDLQAIESLLGITLPSSLSTYNGVSATTGETTPDATQGQTTEVPSEAVQSTSDQCSGIRCQLQLSPAERRKNNDECVDVTQEEFETVSSLVRGRVKLSDVNHTYQRLWTHFKEEGNSDDLDTQTMHKMGLRVTGATGEAKLKVLKSLKLIKMNKKCEVNIV